MDGEKAVTKLSKTGVTWDVEKTVKDAYDVGRSGSIINRYSQVKKDKIIVKIERSYDQKIFDRELDSAASKISWGQRQPITDLPHRGEKEMLPTAQR